jgi:hypothetical protein
MKKLDHRVKILCFVVESKVWKHDLKKLHEVLFEPDDIHVVIYSVIIVGIDKKYKYIFQNDVKRLIKDQKLKESLFEIII